MIAFIFISVTLLGAAIYFVSLLLSVFFLANQLNYIIILASLLFISLGFLIVLSLSHFFNNFCLKIAYRLFSLFIGLLFYLTCLAIVCQIIKLIFPNISLIILAITSLVLAVILFLIGLVEAFIPKIKDISVTMANLPSNWRGKKIVQISDVHLGNVYGVRFLKDKINRINALNPDLVVITGDLFDGTRDDISIYIQELRNIKSKKGVFFVLGNHDLYLEADKVKSVLNSAGINVLQDEAVIIDGLEIVGLSFRKSNSGEPVVKNLSSKSASCRLLLRHVPVGIDWAKKMNIALQLSGHSHRGQMFPLAILTWAIFGKYQYGLHTEGNFNIYTSSGLGSWGPPVRTFYQAEIVVITID